MEMTIRERLDAGTANRLLATIGAMIARLPARARRVLAPYVIELATNLQPGRPGVLAEHYPPGYWGIRTGQLTFCGPLVQHLSRRGLWILLLHEAAHAVLDARG
jgi:hypothetical protein